MIREQNETEYIVRKIKSMISDLIIHEWIETPLKQLKGKSPLQLIEEGDGELIINSLKSLRKDK